jgi:para-aminobenzoate synthetase component 1
LELFSANRRLKRKSGIIAYFRRNDALNRYPPVAKDELFGGKDFIYTHSDSTSGLLGCEGLLLIGEENGPNADFREQKLPEFSDTSWSAGYIAYDYKNEIEDLKSDHPPLDGLSDLLFFEPQQIFEMKSGRWSCIHKINESCLVFNGLSEMPPKEVSADSPQGIKLHCRFSKEEYINQVEKIRKDIGRGEVYELNFCIEFYAEQITVDPLKVFQRLNVISPAPFSALCRLNGLYLISSSPERFICRKGETVFSQPIKGTRRRGLNQEEDDELRNELASDEKERSENVMIVDLVRNDLTRIASRGTVSVEELCGIYSFEQVHQMISTISCTLKSGCSFEDIIRATFPMGSMTGAPKVRAMELIDRYERNRRGLYSGTLGIVKPGGDFDFMVIIRSIIYDPKREYLSCMVGSAITFKSDAGKEYDECLLKAKALFQSLGATVE